MSFSSEDVLVQLVHEIKDNVNEWEEKRCKILQQLESIHNINTQLDSLNKCIMRNSLGVLSTYSTTVTVRLIGKLIESQERALSYVHRDIRVMSNLVKYLMKKRGDCNKLWIKTIEKEGIEVVCQGSGDKFSFSDIVTWIQELSCLVYSNWKRKRESPVNITEYYISVWREEIHEMKNIIELMTHSIKPLNSKLISLVNEIDKNCLF